MRKYDYQQIGFALTTFTTLVAVHLIAPFLIVMTVGTV